MAPVFLTPEIVRRIIYFVLHDWLTQNPFSIWWPLPGAGQYATVSRIWQDEIERKTFAALRLNLDRLSQVNSIVTPRRRGYVRNIRLDIVLPKSGPLGRRESDEEKLRNNRALQATFEAFLQSLSQWNAAELHPKGVELFFQAFAPGDTGHGEYRPESPWRRIRERARKRRYTKSVIELTDPERIAQLPPVMAIVKVDSERHIDRHISLLAICALLAKLPAAKRVSIDWWKSKRFSRMRNDLADALSQINHPMDGLFIGDSSTGHIGRSQYSPTSAPSGEGKDKLSKTIQILSQRLKTISIYDIVVSDEIFYPQALAVDMAEPRWDRLVDFTLYYPPVNYLGELLFLPDPNADESSESEAPLSDDDTSNSSRSSRSSGHESACRLKIPTPAMQQFYLSAARAALQMPALKHMTLVANLQMGDNWHKFWYYTGGPTPKARWTSNTGFIPQDEVLECWRKVGRKHMEAELEVELLDDEDAM